MKKTLIIAMVMMLACGVAANAGYLWGAGAYTTSGTNGGTALTFGEFSPAGTAAQGTSSATSAFTAIVPNYVENQGGKTLLQKAWMATAPEAWIIQVWTGADYSASQVSFRIWGSGTSADTVARQIKVLADPTNTYAKNTVLNVDPVVWVKGAYNGTLAYSVVLPAFKTSTPANAGQGIVLSFEPVPEPGSVVAMLSGIVGLAGFGIRRRK